MLFCLFVVLYSLMVVAIITSNINFIPMLNDSNFKLWQENLLIVLAVMDYDLVLKVDFPPPFTYENTLDNKKKIKTWERSNHMCSMIIKKVISKAFKGSISKKATTTKEFLAEIE